MEESLDPVAERHLRDIRRSLEEEYQAKRREAQVRERRMRELLAKDREQWEAWKRDEKARLSQQAETLRRREENARLETQRKKDARVGLDEARQDVEAERAAWAEERTGLERRMDAWAQGWTRAQASRRRGALLAGVVSVCLILFHLTQLPSWLYAALAVLVVQAWMLGRRMRSADDAADDARPAPRGDAGGAHAD